MAKSSRFEVMNMQFTLAQLSLCDAVKEGRVYTHHRPECIARPQQADLTSYPWLEAQFDWLNHTVPRAVKSPAFPGAP